MIDAVQFRNGRGAVSDKMEARLRGIEARIAQLEVREPIPVRAVGASVPSNPEAVLRRVLPSIKQDLEADFRYHDIDSFDLVELRVVMEEATGLRPDDIAWTSCQSPADVLAVFSGPAALPPTALKSLADEGAELKIVVNMPQMAVGGLSEFWLLKELGDRHWHSICQALSTSSSSIADSAGHRLYATFVRIRWASARSLFDFRENEELVFASKLTRHGGSMLFSEATFTAADGSALDARLMTSFALRSGDNTSLTRAEPVIPGDAVRVEPVLPAFAADYRSMRRGSTQTLALGGAVLEVRPQAEAMWSSRRAINPYTDLNGVELLYFAAYPLIADLAERDWVIETAPLELTRDFALAAATVERDVYYYANCDLGDAIDYHLLDWAVQDDEIATLAALTRSSDDTTIAHVATCRRLRG